MHLQEKADRLHQILQSYGRVAVAFSGGSDSSMLLKCALDSLGAGNVLIFFGKSEMLKQSEVEVAENWLSRNGFPLGVEMRVVDLQPLSWTEFVKNPEERCYLCKRRIYSRFREIMDKTDFSVLIDGTNTDDLKDRRPGLRAIHELDVKTPLVTAGFTKDDVRQYSRRLRLDSWDLPSASCLATRIPYGLEITGERIRQIEFWENGVEKLGFTGCRVRMNRQDEATVFIQVASQDFEILFAGGMRIALFRFFQKNGIKKVFIDIEGR